jgi:hypothetical protein
MMRPNLLTITAMNWIRLNFSLAALGAATLAHGQVEIDQPIELTGGAGERAVRNLEMPSDPNDAASKAYVDAEIQSQLSGGSFSAPNMTTAQRDALSPAPGDIIFNTTQNCYNLYNGTLWIVMCADYTGPAYGVAYDTANDAYWAERNLGYRDVYVREKQRIYTWNATDKVYQRVTSGGTYILVPDRNSSEVNTATFYGYGVGGASSSNNFQWDGQTVSPSLWDVGKLFVSPGGVTMNYCKAIYNNYSGPCDGTNSSVVISAPTVYGMKSPGTYTAWTGQELFTGGSDLIAEQSLESGSYCTAAFGKGWRLPTDNEVGHTNALSGTGYGYDTGYAPSQVRTSCQFQSDPTRRWHVNGNTYWENDGYLNAVKEVRCVFAR